VVVDNYVTLAPFTRVVGDLWDWTASGDIAPDLRSSAIELAIGFGIGVLVGVVLGVAMGLFDTLRRLLETTVVALNSTPILALAPLFVIWLGFSLAAKFVLIAAVAVFPVLVNTQVGIRQVDRAYLDVARVFGASWWQLVRKVRFPAALPFVLAGMRVAVTRAVVGIFVAELFGATSGVGFAINNASATFDSARMFSGLIVLGLFGILLSALIGGVARWAAPWQGAHRDES
jgi:NitT/TauT family transport system permease protein